MKNKLLVMILAAVCAFVCALGLAACDSDGTTEHTHNWSQAWTSDGTHHWHNCTASGCTITDNSKKNGYAAHDFSSGDCICGKKNTANHSHSYKWVNNWDGTHKQHCQNADCPEPDINDGAHTYTSTGLGSRCDKCGDFEAPEGHTHDYVWKDDGAGSHYIHCQAEGCYYPNPSSSTEQHIWGVNGICDKCRAVDQQQHTHNWSTEYYCRDSDHIQKCDSCNFAKNGDHIYPSEGAACSLCGHKKTTVSMDLTFELNEDGQSYSITKFQDRFGTVTNAVIPCVHFGLPVTSISEEAFKNSNITSAEISGCCLPNRGSVVMRIESRAFTGCAKLKSVVIPQTVTEIGSGAFEGCSALTDITVPFVGASKDAETGKAHFGYIFGANRYGDNYSFVPQTLTTVAVTGGTVIAERAFSSCHFSDLTLPNGITSIGAYAFPTTLKNINIPNTVTSIGAYAFAFSGITSITLPDGMQAIEQSLFQNCRSLNDITIGGGIKSIGSDAFKNCDKLKDIYYAGNLTGWCGITGLDELMSTSTTLYVDGRKLTGEIMIPNSVTSIGAKAFYGCGEITGVSIPSGVTSIGNGAFDLCGKLKSITVSENNSAYASQDGILYNKAKTTCIHVPADLEGEITVPNGVTHMSFANPKITAINLPDSLTNISLVDCGVTTLTLPADIMCVSISECKRLTTLRYKGTSAQWQSVEFIKDNNCPPVTCLGDISAN